MSVLATTLSTCTSATPCNPWSGVSANEVDLSLIEIDAAAVSAILEVLDIGPLSSVVARSALSTAQAIEVMGRTTRYSALQIGGLAVCIGAKPPQDHPHIYLNIGDFSEIVCPYCSTLFRFDPSLGTHEADPADCAYGDMD